MLRPARIARFAMPTTLVVAPRPSAMTRGGSKHSFQVAIIAAHELGGVALRIGTHAERGVPAPAAQPAASSSAKPSKTILFKDMA